MSTGKSVVQPTGSNAHSCGYCHSKDDTSFTYGVWAHSLTCKDYQDFIDRGWRRSGKYLYKPDLNKSCCPQYTIRLDANKFQLTKSQRKVLSKFNRFIEGSWGPHVDQEMDQKQSTEPSKVNPDTNKPLSHNIHLVEEKPDFRHKFQVILEPSSYTDEKFKLYQDYQVHIHKDEPGEVTKRSFERFLVDSPLYLEPFGDKAGKVVQSYGSFHQRYILDGKLIAMAVLDILPKCVSSVYFMYSHEYGFLGLGKYSALREISLTQELSEVASDLHWYYMGFYIHSCPKMNYKGSYQPSYLLDPETYDWYPIEGCRKLLNEKKFVVFSKPDEDYKDDNRIPGTLTTKQIKQSDVEKVYIEGNDDEGIPATELVVWHRSHEFRHLILEYVGVVGRELSSRLFLN